MWALLQGAIGAAEEAWEDKSEPEDMEGFKNGDLSILARFDNLARSLVESARVYSLARDNRGKEAQAEDIKARGR